MAFHSNLCQKIKCESNGEDPIELILKEINLREQILKTESNLNFFFKLKKSYCVSKTK